MFFSLISNMHTHYETRQDTIKIIVPEEANAPPPVMLWGSRCKQDGDRRGAMKKNPKTKQKKAEG